MAIHEESQNKVATLPKYRVSTAPIKSQARVVSEQHAPWWQVYVIVALLLVVLFIVPSAIINATESKVIEVFAILIFFGWLLRWVHKHEAALNREYYQKTEDNYDRQR